MTDSFKVEKYELGLYLYDTISIKKDKEIIQIPVLKSAIKEDLTGKEIEIEHKDGVFDSTIEKVIFKTIKFDKH